MKRIIIAASIMMLLGGCSQKEISEGASDIGNDIKRVIKGEN